MLALLISASWLNQGAEIRITQAPPTNPKGEGSWSLRLNARRCPKLNPKFIDFLRESLKIP